MSISNIPANSLTSLLGAVDRAATERGRPHVEQGRVTYTPTPSAAPSPRPAAARGASTPLPLDPPAGTDPELWSVLTSEERAFFAKADALSSLTYGRVGAGATAALPARGGRLDVWA